MDEDLFDDADSFGPIFTATHESEDACCGDGIVAGERIRADGSGGWIHADNHRGLCGRDKAGDHGGVVATCPLCWLQHAPGQKECDR